jgi:hypothetical protein
MPCYPAQFPATAGGRSSGFICSRGARPRRCVGCRRYVADRLCDVPVPGRDRAGAPKTCSAPVCTTCVLSFGGSDVCTAHPVPDAFLAAQVTAR